jgi:hypothetical protein
MYNLKLLIFLLFIIINTTKCKSDDKNIVSINIDNFYIVKKVNKDLLNNSPFFSISEGDTLYFDLYSSNGLLNIKQNLIGFNLNFEASRVNEFNNAFNLKYSNNNFFKWNSLRAQKGSFDETFVIRFTEQSMSVQIELNENIIIEAVESWNK